MSSDDIRFRVHLCASLSRYRTIFERQSSIFYYIVRYRTISYDFVRYRMISCDIVRYANVHLCASLPRYRTIFEQQGSQSLLYRTMSCDIVRYRTISCDIVRYRTISCDIVRYANVHLCVFLPRYRTILEQHSISYDIQICILVHLSASNLAISHNIVQYRTISYDIVRYR